MRSGSAIGGAAFGFLVPVLAGYIAFGMADRPGLVPGFVGGAIAVTIEAGFLGGLVAGLLSGAVVMAIQRAGVPPALRGIMPVLVIPLIGSAVVGFLMFVVVGEPLAALQRELTDWLDGLSGSNAMLLGLVLATSGSVDLLGLFHARKLRAHQWAIEHAGWDAVHARLRITRPFYDRFTPAISTRDFALRRRGLDRALDFLAVLRP